MPKKSSKSKSSKKRISHPKNPNLEKVHESASALLGYGYGGALAQSFKMAKTSMDNLRHGKSGGIYGEDHESTLRNFTKRR